MFEDEMQAQFADVTGMPVRFCDVCGKQVTGSNLITRGRGSSPLMAERLLRVCDECYVEIEGGEIPVGDNGAEILGTEVVD